MYDENDVRADQQQHEIVARSVYGPDSDITQAVFATLADVPGFDSSAIDGTLYDAVDPDALEAVFATTRSSDRSAGRITFPFAGYELTVTADGEVVVSAPVPRVQ